MGGLNNLNLFQKRIRVNALDDNSLIVTWFFNKEQPYIDIPLH